MLRRACHANQQCSAGSGERWRGPRTSDSARYYTKRRQGEPPNAPRHKDTKPRKAPLAVGAKQREYKHPLGGAGRDQTPEKRYFTMAVFSGSELAVVLLYEATCTSCTGTKIKSNQRRLSLFWCRFVFCRKRTSFNGRRITERTRPTLDRRESSAPAVNPAGGQET